MRLLPPRLFTAKYGRILNQILKKCEKSLILSLVRDAPRRNVREQIRQLINRAI